MTTAVPHAPVDPDAARAFLELPHLVVVGASDMKGNFGATVVKALRDAGRDVVAVNPNATVVAGARCYPDLASVPEPVDGVIVMVRRDRAAEVVVEAAKRGIRRVWLFQGLGGHGAVSDLALEACREYGIEVIAGACPLMFLEPVGWFHRIHRSARRRNGSVLVG